MNIDFGKNETAIPAVNEHLAELQGKAIYYDPLKGNLGDDLILKGIEAQFARFDLNFVPEIESADHVLIKGGGALLDDYKSLLEHIGQLLKRSSDIPTTILPTSYRLEKTSLSDLAGHRTKPLRVYAREQYSYELLNGLDFSSETEIGWDHDSAFHLANTPFIQDLKRKTNGKHLLVVERTDTESISGEAGQRVGAVSSRPSRLRSLANLLPTAMKAPLKHRLILPKIEARARESEFSKLAIDFLHKNHPETAGLPIHCHDVSQNHINTFDQFVRLIANSSVVFSTRLHVGILSAMLGIPTYLVAGVYHKLRGIYRYSMSNNEHIKLVDKSLNELKF